MAQYETQQDAQTVRRPWIRLSGIGLAFAGAILAALGAIVFTNPGPAAYEIMDPVAAVVFVALALGLPAYYAHEQHWFGRLARVGFGVLAVGAIVAGLGFALTIWLVETAFLAFLVGFLLMLAGAFVYGIAMRRAAAPPRIGSLLLIAALPVGIVVAAGIVAAGAMVPPWAGAMVVYGLAMVVLGKHVLR